MKYPNIEAERARAGMSQLDVTKLLGISTKSYQNWQRGVSDIPVSKLCNMASIFCCTTDYLLGRIAPTQRDSA